jgi:hypothetical protein
MNSIHHILLIGVAIAFFGSCTHVPRSSNQTDATANIRAQYLHDHPGGKFNDRIIKGELVKGMNVVEVLASWGIPDQRRTTDHNSETWTYTSRDDFSKDFVSYALVFRDQVLTRWLLERTTAAGRGRPTVGIADNDPAQEPVLVLPGGLRPRNSVPKK